MEKYLPLLIGFLLISILIPLRLPAQDMAEEELFFIEMPMVFTASKRLQSIEESPAAVTVLTAEDIRRSGARNLGEVLRQVPGLEVMSLTPADYAVGARGMIGPKESGILTLVNGRSVYLDFWGLVMWTFLEIPLEEIERIEVVRGPGSVLYGANAFHAVINIITRAPGDNPGTSLNLAGGPDAILGSALYSGRSGKASYTASAGWMQFSGYEKREDVVLQYPHGHANVTYDFEEMGKVNVEAGLARGDFNMFYDIIGLLEISGLRSHVKAEYSRPDFYLRAFWNNLRADPVHAEEIVFDEFDFMGIPIYLQEGWEFDTWLEENVVDVEAQQTLELPWSQIVIAGLNYRHLATQTPIFAQDQTQDMYAAYAQHEFRFRNLLHTYLGLRYDYHPLTEHNLSPRGSVLVTPVAGHIFRLSAGQSYRSPNLLESYSSITIPLSLGDFTLQGNQDLDPEQLVSYEAGYQANIMRGRVSLIANVFFNQMTGEMEASITNFADLTAEAVNYSDLEAAGFETGIVGRPYPWLSAFVNYSFNNITLTRRGDETVDEDLTTAPQHKVNGGVSVDLEQDISASLLVHYRSETSWPTSMIADLGDLDGYTLVNLRAGYRFFRDRAEVSVSVFNLFNDTHQEFPLREFHITEEIGTRVMGKGSITF